MTYVLAPTITGVGGLLLHLGECYIDKALNSLPRLFIATVTYLTSAVSFQTLIDYFFCLGLSVFCYVWHTPSVC